MSLASERNNEREIAAKSEDLRCHSVKEGNPTGFMIHRQMQPLNYLFERFRNHIVI
jgi:hypothetical protein